MPQVAQIILPDAQATPVNHTFVPQGRDTNGVWWFEDQSAAAVNGFNRISVALTEQPPQFGAGQNLGTRVKRVKIGIHCPTLETTSNNSAGLPPPPTVAYIERVNIEFIHPERGNLQNRKDVNKFAYGVLQHADVRKVIEDVQNYFG